MGILRSLCFSLFFFAFFHRCTGLLNITGNEEPLTIGLSRDINCTWSGGGNVSKMEWFVGGLEAVAVETTTEARSLVLTLAPDDNGLDGAMFTCRATLANGVSVEESITLILREIENTVSITSTVMNATAGLPYTLLCVVSSERPSELSWIDPTGVPCPLNGPNITVTRGVWSGGVNTIELTFNSIKTSQSGVYRCISNITAPPSKSEASFLVTIQIPALSVMILLEPDINQLYTTDSLVLTCVIDLIPEVDSLVAINSQWRGHSSLTDRERRVIVSELEGVQLTYQTTVTFTSLKSSDSGSYICSATVSPLSENLIGSHSTEENVAISVALKVEMKVVYSPPSDFDLPSPPYYRPATAVTITCNATGGVGGVYYQWASTSSRSFANGSTESYTVSTSILKSYDAGVHTCTAYDSLGNSGSQSTEMRLIGAGIYVASSRYITSVPVTNNSLIVKRLSSYNKIDVYCYSNSTSTSVGYYVFSNGDRMYSNSGHYDYTVSRVSPAGIYLTSYSSRTPDIWGVFTCEIPDSNGNTLETSIGIYSSMPSGPSVYNIDYTDWSQVNSDWLATVVCLTQYSPPTTVTWTRDGVAVEVDGVGYEMLQAVIERQSYSRYNNTLIIRDAADLAGDHSYCCRISNSAGRTSRCVSTTWNVRPQVTVSQSKQSINSEPFTATCRASIRHIGASHLIHYVVINWMSADGRIISQEDRITIEDQQTFSDSVTRAMVFDSLDMAHGGDYTCQAHIMLPGSTESFNTTLHYHLNVLSRTLFQLKFGPVVHCSKWYENKDMVRILAWNLKEFLTNLINKNCSCGFRMFSQIDQNEFSCRSVENGYVMFRARLTGSSDTQSVPVLLEVISDWIRSDGTFLYHYNGRMRLGLDKDCPLEITSFSQPECRKNSLAVKQEL